MALKHKLQASQGPVTVANMPGHGSVRRDRRYAFTPAGQQPPAGSYDPSLDAAVGRTDRGYGDLLADYAPADGSQGTPGRLTQRAQDDYNIGVGNVTGEGGSYTRGLADLLKERGRATQDFQTQREGINRGADRQLADTSLSFRNLAAGQADQQNATGTLEGGAALQAQEKRAANQGRIDSRTQEDRGLQLGALGQRESRYGEDSSTDETRLGQDRDRALGQLGLGYQRFSDDATTQLGRAGREQTFFHQDTDQQRIAQAKANGWTQPIRPHNEHSDAQGPYRVVKIRGQKVKVRPDGTVEH
jgi:hypothetical protein